jgi:hypothetical protein
LLRIYFTILKADATVTARQCIATPLGQFTVKKDDDTPYQTSSLSDSGVNGTS